MRRGISASFSIILSILLISAFLYSKEKDIDRNQVKLDLLSYRLLPVNKPQFDYMSTLKANSKSLGLKKNKEMRRLLNQSNNIWAIRAVQRHILEKQNHIFQTNQVLNRENRLKNTQAEINFSLFPYCSPQNKQILAERRTTFSFRGLINPNTEWYISSYFWQSAFNYKFNKWKTIGIFKFNRDSHSFKINLGIEENPVYYFPLKSCKKGRLWSGSLKFSDMWNISHDLILTYGIKYDYFRWIRTFNLISPNLKFLINLSDTIKIKSGFSYDWSTPGEISFLSDKMTSLLGYYYISGEIKPEKSLKCFLSFEKNIGSQSLINIKAHYKKIENQILTLPLFRKKNSNSPEFIYFIYNIGEVEDKGLNITFSKEIGSLLHGSISYGLIFSQSFDGKRKLITLPQILSSNLLQDRVIHIISSIIEARIPLINTVILANYNWSSEDLFYNSYSLNYLKSRIKIRQELPFLNFYGKVKIILDLINFLESNDLLQNNECIILLPYSRRIIGGIEINF